MTLAQWYDLRDLGNPVHALLLWVGRWGPHWLVYVVAGLIGAAAILAFVVPSQLVLIWWERRFLARFQIRRGPNRVGKFGLLQSLADGFKIMAKETWVPRAADKWPFLLAPIVMMVPSIMLFAVLPFGKGMVFANLPSGIVYLVALSGVGTIAVFMAGWAANNKYALLGAMRSIAMLLSYEIPAVLALLTVVVYTGSMNLQVITRFQAHYNAWGLFLLPVPLLVYLVSSTAELNRTPADIAEAESELGAGYHTEYSGFRFVVFYAAEFTNTVVVAAVISTCFLGGWSLFGLDTWIPGWIIYISKIFVMFSVFGWVRGTLPRLRIDQLMAFAWKFMLPVTLVNLVAVTVEIALWQQLGWSAGAAFPLFAVANWLLAGVLLVGGWRVFGITRIVAPRRPRMFREVGAVIEANR